MLSAGIAGIITGFALIVVIGAQNALVLRQGLRREHVAVVVAVCVAGDVTLISAGTAGIGALVGAVPHLLTAITWLGAAYLTWQAIASFRSAVRARALVVGNPRSRGSILAAALGVTWLNPHVYLDTMVTLGTIASTYGLARWAFAVGAMSASTVWFSGLGVGARLLARPLGRPITWRIVDAGTGVVMLAVAGTMLAGL